MAYSRASIAKMGGRKVWYPSENPLGNGSGLLYGLPGRNAKGVVIVHEWWGLEDFIRTTASQIGEEKVGFTVLAVDVFRGKTFDNPRQARENMLSLNYTRAAQDVCAAVRYLKSRGCPRVGVIGYGFGGSLALIAAALFPDEIDAVAPHCGVPRPELADLTKIKCPVQGHFAAKDKVVGVSSPADYNPMSEKLWNANVQLEMCIYNAEHAFVNPNYPMYDESASEEYYENLFRFLDEKLDPESDLL